MRCAWLLLAAITSSTTAAAQDVPLQRGVVVQPESVTVGDPFRVVIRVRAPRGTVLEFPEGPDTTARVEPLDRVSVVPGTDTTFVEQTATYRLAAWDTGRLPLRFADVIARLDGRERRIAVGRGVAVEVTSVLPADTTERVPRPVRPVFEFGVPWWTWLLVALAALVLGALFWWWWRRRPAVQAARPDPYVVAMRDFDHIESLGLAVAGEVGHHVALCADVLRTYLSRVDPAARIALTTSELAHAMRDASHVPQSRVLRVLHDIDLVKFARHRIAGERARDLGDECRAIVAAIHGAEQAAAVPRAA